ncbi:hypothetical protein Ae706Ps2_6163 [Pseudonocardia sp. Ae706_Ps2]|nr:hypothetical protein Ae331Ps2_6078 [Pseudonocardia sp. Ae331_Ps2]OLM09701.1 hypothetical protein Ae706Ps2_6163 [Pseudonocardia sp. Ae706_Ps2]
MQSHHGPPGCGRDLTGTLRSPNDHADPHGSNYCSHLG